MEKPLERGEVINVNIKRLIAEVIEKNPHIAAIIVDQDGLFVSLMTPTSKH
jgi:hypothetical protein